VTGTTLSQSELVPGVAALLDGDQEAIQNPYAVWSDLLDRAPVYRDDPSGRVVVVRHEDVARILQDTSGTYGHNMAKSQYMRDFRASLSAPDQTMFDDYYAFRNLFISAAEPAEHARLRRIAHKVFTPRRIHAMEAGIQGFLDDLIAQTLPDHVTDIMELAYQLPLLVIVDMLGCPDDRERVHQWSRAIGSQLDRADLVTLRAAVEATAEFRVFVDASIAEHRSGAPEQDLVSALLQAYDGEQLSDDELAAMFVLLLFAGHETTTNLIATGLYELLRNRDQWEKLCRNSELVPGAVEELLRFVSPVQMTTRRILKSHRLEGVELREDDIVVLANAAANRDPAVFADPQVLNIERADPRRHLALGNGPKFCLGASLARLEGQVVFRTLIRRFPDMELASDEMRFTGSATLRSLTGLPVRLGRDRRAGEYQGVVER
jgi:cytochrome P450